MPDSLCIQDIHQDFLLDFFSLSGLALNETPDAKVVFSTMTMPPSIGHKGSLNHLMKVKRM